MNEIQVGEYIRTDNGEIAKVQEVLENRVYGLGSDGLGTYFFEEIVKHSFDKIEIVEEGDYVNGKRIDHILVLPDLGKLLPSHGKVLVYYADISIQHDMKYYTSSEIKTILTHEMVEMYSFDMEV